MYKSLLPLLLLAAAMIVGCDEGEITHDMARFDRAYVPALVLTSTKDISGQSVLAVKRLRQDWELVSAKYSRIFTGGEASMNIGSIIERSDGLITIGDFAGAHAELERIRVLMMDARRRNGIEYYLDPLTVFHQSMEKMASRVSGKDHASITEEDIRAIAGMLPLARKQWQVVTDAPFKRGPFLFTRDNEAALMDAVAAEGRAIEDLGDALRSRNRRVIARHVLLLKQGYSMVLRMFGNFDSISI